MKLDTTSNTADFGVSTPCAPLSKLPEHPKHRLKHWYALRTTYGQEMKAHDYLLEKNVEVYLPTITKVTVVHGKRVKKQVSRLPNIFFARGTFEELKEHVYDNIHLPFLRFYYSTHGMGADLVRTPLIVPDGQMRSLKIVCGAISPDVLLVPDHVHNFKKGQQVRVIEGEFKGIEGHVARWHGQQRVAVIIDSVCTIATAYIPSAFLMPIEK